MNGFARSSDLTNPGLAFARAIATERDYFDLGARLETLPGASLAWMPGLTASPAAAVIHRVDPVAVVEMSESWIAQAEQALADTEARLARVYLDERGSAADDLLRRAGYRDRDELVFAHNLPDPSSELVLRLVTSDQDWERKLRLHESIPTPPDGHDSSAADWVDLERRKCGAGMESFLAELDEDVVGAVSAVWGDEILRLKNLVVHPAHRRRSVGTAIICALAAVGRNRGVSHQCTFAVRGEAGELLYRSAGMTFVGTQVEWSKPIGRPAA